jgi:hypothetical protein
MANDLTRFALCSPLSILAMLGVTLSRAKRLIPGLIER